MQNKILSLLEAQKKIQNFKKRGKKIVLCHGVFDIIHPGHIDHFKFSKNKGDILVISVTSDQFVNKGFGRPIFDVNKRKLFLSNLSFVDIVVESDNKSAVSIIKKLKPNFYAKGPDYKVSKDDLTGKINDEIKAIKSVKGKFIISKGFTYSSSKMINQHFSQDSDQNKFLNKISRVYSKKQILDSIEKLSKLNVLVIGESIIDEYNFCETIGKSGKEPVLNVKKLYSKKYLGGGLAICKNLSTFCNKVSFISYLGENNEEKKFIRKKLEKNIITHFINKKNSPTIIKRRFLENVSNIKNLGVYSVNDEFLSNGEENQIISKIKSLSKKSDLIIVSDYGHGLITKKIAKLISSFKKKYFVNAQLNSNNLGNHNLESYRNPNAIVINENELRHELRDRNSSVITLGRIMKSKKNANSVLITQGKDGATLLGKNKNIKCPAFASSVYDKIGSGDAMLSIFSICSAIKINPLLSLYLSSLSAAQNVQSLANEKTVSKDNILKIVKHNFN